MTDTSVGEALTRSPTGVPIVRSIGQVPTPSFTESDAGRVALVTCQELAEGDPDDKLLAVACEQLGLSTHIVAWTDPTVAWAEFDAVVLRSTWDYADRRDDFLDWASGVPTLVNPYAVVEWNTDKSYLERLAQAAVPVVPTIFVRPGTLPDLTVLPATPEVVVKPTVGAGSRGAGRFRLADERPQLEAHVAALHTAGRTAMVQPYLAGVDADGETALVFLEGAFSHAVRKGAMLASGARFGVDDQSLYIEERITPREPDEQEHQVAAKVMGHLHSLLGEPPLYARIDLLPGDRGPMLVELELTEPSLFLGHSDGAAERLAGAIARRIRLSR